MLPIKSWVRLRAPLVVARRETYDGPKPSQTEAGETNHGSAVHADVDQGDRRSAVRGPAAGRRWVAGAGADQHTATGRQRRFPPHRAAAPPPPSGSEPGPWRR